MVITRRIGNTLYKVRIYFDEKGTLTMEDRIMRLIANECEAAHLQKRRKANEIAV